MIYKTICFLAAAVALSVASEARAVPLYYNVDNTIVGGPIELENGAISAYDSVNHQWTISGDAVNLTSQSFPDVDLLNEWVFQTSPTSSAYTFNTGTDNWTGANTFALDAPDGNILMNQTSPQVLNHVRGADTAMLNSTDSVPFIDVHAVGPFGTTHFSYKVDSLSNFAFALDTSFVSLTQPVPEPSTLVLGLLAFAGLGCVLRRGRLAAK